MTCVRPDEDHPHNADEFGVLSPVALLLVFAFGLGRVWSTLGLLVRTPSALLNMGMLVLFPLTFASNVFVDPHTLPRWLRGFVDANPITRLVTADALSWMATRAPPKSAGC